MTNNITNRQMFFIVFLVLTTYTTIDLPKTMAQFMGRGSWVPILIMALLFGIVAIFIVKLNNMYPGKSVFDYSSEIVGSFLRYVIAVYYLLYFIVIGSFLKIRLAGLLSANFLPDSEPFLILLVGVPLFGYVAYKGITNIARLFELFGVLFLIITLFLCIMMVIQGNIEQVQPLFNTRQIKMYLNTMKELVVPYGGVEILLIIPFTQHNKKAPGTIFATLVFIGLFYVLIVQSTLMILGVNNAMALNHAFIEAIKVVDAPVIERTDIFYLTFGLSSLFCGMIIVFCAILEFACRIFQKVKRIYLTALIAILLYTLSLLGLTIPNINQVFGRAIVIPVLISIVIIPVTLFIVAKIRNKAAGQSNKEAQQ